MASEGRSLDTSLHSPLTVSKSNSFIFFTLHRGILNRLILRIGRVGQKQPFFICMFFAAKKESRSAEDHLPRTEANICSLRKADETSLTAVPPSSPLLFPSAYLIGLIKDYVRSCVGMGLGGGAKESQI